MVKTQFLFREDYFLEISGMNESNSKEVFHGQTDLTRQLKTNNLGNNCGGLCSGQLKRNARVTAERTKGDLRTRFYCGNDCGKENTWNVTSPI